MVGDPRLVDGVLHRHLKQIRNANAIHLADHSLVSTKAAGLEEHWLHQVSDGLGRWLRGGAADGKGIDKGLKHLDGAGLARLEGKALAGVILVGDTVQRHLLLLQPGQYPRFIGSPLASAGCPYGAVHQGALCRLL
jgi:hypothetical protein